MERTWRAAASRQSQIIQTKRRPDPARAEFLVSGCLSAPVQIIVRPDGRSQYPDYNHWDGPLAARHLMLAARALGYDTARHRRPP